MQAPSAGEQRTAKKRYDQLATIRSPYLQRAEDLGKYALPRLYPKGGNSSATEFYKPWQSVIGQGVMGFSSKLTLALLPPNRKPFRLGLSAKTKAQLEQMDSEQKDLDATGKFNSALSNIESTVMAEIDASGHRRAAHQIFQHLQVSGNCAYDMGNPDPKVYGLNQFVVVRDREGNMVEMILLERVAKSTLSEKVRADLQRRQMTPDRQGEEQTDNVNIYTWMRLVKNTWRIHQEADEVIIEESRGQYPKDSPRFVALRWGRVDGEDYGRSLLEDNAGDVSACEALAQSITQFALAAGHIVYLVNPYGSTDIGSLAEAQSGDFRPGNAADITVPEIKKSFDLAVVKEVLGSIYQRLAVVFLQTSGLRRDAERVTAEEIRMLANEIDTTNAGMYSTLALEYQLPLVRWTMFRMRRDNKLPALPEGSVDLTIVGGIDALGRTADLMQLDEFVRGAQEAIGPQATEYLKIGSYLTRRATALSLNPTELVKSDEEVAQARQQMQQASLLEKAAPNAVNAISDLAQGQQAQAAAA